MPVIEFFLYLYLYLSLNANSRGSLCWMRYPRMLMSGSGPAIRMFGSTSYRRSHSPFADIFTRACHSLHLLPNSLHSSIQQRSPFHSCYVSATFLKPESSIFFHKASTSCFFSLSGLTWKFS